MAPTGAGAPLIREIAHKLMDRIERRHAPR
jgi:hypothetical protein